MFDGCLDGPVQSTDELGMLLELQKAVNGLMDNTIGGGGPESAAGIRQVLEKKEGLFRKHMMVCLFSWVKSIISSPVHSSSCVCAAFFALFGHSGKASELCCSLGDFSRSVLGDQ